jgi:hypothetical protein
LAAHSGKNHNWRHILGKQVIGSTFWEKHDWQHILGNTKIFSTFWKKHNWQHFLGKQTDLQHILGTTCLTAHSGKKT